LDMTLQKKLLQQIVKNTSPKPTEPALDQDPNNPQVVWGFEETETTIMAGAVAVLGLPLRPPPGSYYRIKSINYGLETSDQSAAQQIGFGMVTDEEATRMGAWALPYLATWGWVSPVVAISHAVFVESCEGLGYQYYEIGAGYDYYFVPFPPVLITNDRPLRFYAVAVAGDFIWCRVVYEVVRI